MSLMKRFQEQKQKDPSYGEGGGFSVLGAMPTSAIARQQAVTGFEKELADDLVKLKLIRSIKQKETEKAEHLVPKYMPMVKILKASGSDHPLLGQILVWLFDVANIPEAMELAIYCIDHKVAMPERFRRDLPTFLGDAIGQWAEDEHEAGRTPDPYFTQICELSAEWDLPDEVNARFYRLRGLIAFDHGHWAVAVTELEKATHYGAKVKTWLARARKKLGTD